MSTVAAEHGSALLLSLLWASPAARSVSPASLSSELCWVSSRAGDGRGHSPSWALPPELGIRNGSVRQVRNEKLMRKIRVTTLKSARPAHWTWVFLKTSRSWLQAKTSSCKSSVSEAVVKALLAARTSFQGWIWTSNLNHLGTWLDNQMAEFFRWKDSVLDQILTHMVHASCLFFK